MLQVKARVYFLRQVLAGLIALLLCAAAGAKADGFDLKPIINGAIIDAPVADVWEAWTTTQGVTSFMAPGAEIEGHVGGVYRAIFYPQAIRPIDRGNDGRIIAMEQHKFLAFSWMTPLHMEELKGNSTVILVYFFEESPTRTRVDLVNVGYGQSDLWRKAYDYNVKGWDRILSGLEYRFEAGPINWEARIQEFKSGKGISYWREKRRETAD